MSENFWDESLEELKFNSSKSRYKTYGWIALIVVVIILIFTLPFIIQSRLAQDPQTQKLSSKIKSTVEAEVKGSLDKNSQYDDYYRQVIKESKEVKATPLANTLSSSPGLGSLETAGVEQCYKDVARALSFTKTAYDLAVASENKRFQKENPGENAPSTSSTEVHRNNLKKILADYERTIVLVKSQYNCSESSGNQVIN